MATAKKLPSGKWRVRTCDDGVRRSYTADTKKEAERLAAIGIEEERLNRIRDMTLEEAIEAYIATCKAQGYSPSTIAEYTARKKASYPKIIKTKLSRLTAHDIQAQIDERAANHSVKTLRNDFFLLRAVLDVYAPKLDLRKIKMAKRQKRPRLLLSEHMPAAILTIVSDTPPDLQIYVLLSMFAGLRPSEVYALHWEDLSKEPITVATNPPYQVGQISVSAAEVRDEKGNYQRKAPKTESGNRTQIISWAVFDQIYSIKDRGADDEKVVSLTSKKAALLWKRLKDEKKIPDHLRLYDLRHFYATAVANSGASEEELAARMGHSTSAFSHQVYVELFEERRENVNSVLSAATAAAIEKAQKTINNSKDGHENGHDQEKIAQ